MSKGETVREALKVAKEEGQWLMDKGIDAYIKDGNGGVIRSIVKTIDNLYVAVKGLAEIEGVV